MQETAIQSSDNKQKFKLALQFTIDAGELDALCKAIQSLIDTESDKGSSGGIIGVLITRMIKHAIDMKFEEKLLFESLDSFTHDHKEPQLNVFKANIVRGMLVTFIEHPVGYPGFFDIMSGIAASGLGVGSIKLHGSENAVKLSKLQQYYPDKKLSQNAQIELLRQLFTADSLSAFPNIRIGAYSILSGCALLPFYTALLKLNTGSTAADESLLIEAASMIRQRFSGNSERLRKFFAQNLFRVLFEELFTHESTVFSLYNS